MANQYRNASGKPLDPQRSFDITQLFDPMPRKFTGKLTVVKERRRFACAEAFPGQGFAQAANHCDRASQFWLYCYAPTCRFVSFREPRELA
jgi:hypothetical protein